MKRMAYLSVAVLVLALAASAQNANQETKYTNNSFARLSHITGNTYVQKAADLGYEEGQINMPLAEGDRIGTTEGRAEIYLGKKNYVRLDQNTKLDFLSLPRKDSDLIRLQNWAGNIYLEINTLEKEKSVEILTPDATFYVLDRGRYRIDVKENKETEILVYSGIVEASGAEGSVLLKKEQRLTVSDGRFLSKPDAFIAAAGDAFDGFNDSRNSQVFKTSAQRYLTDELADFENELDQYGDWMYLPEFGYVWAPRGMGSDWRPYYYGRWSWLPMAGWNWIPYEPWGWAPFHYGRWGWQFGMGWYWIPMHYWGPGWVNWWWDDYYFGWAPSSYWGYPGIIIDNHYYGRGWNGDYPLNSRALTVVHKNQLQNRNISRAALNPDSIKAAIPRLQLTEKALNVRPVSSKNISLEPIQGGKKIILKSGGAEEGKLQRINRPDASPAKSREIQGQKPADSRATQEPKRTDTKATAPKATEQGRQGEAAQPTKSASPPPRKIKKDGEPGSGALETNAYPRRTEALGYPSRNIARQSVPQGNRSSEPSSVLDKFYRTFSGGSGSSAPRVSPNRGSSSGGSGSKSAPRTMSRPSTSRGSSGGGSRPTGGSSRSSGGGSRSSGGGRKK
jgi:hypothetical protein